MSRRSQSSEIPQQILSVLPRWARLGEEVADSENVAFQAGGALALLHSRVVSEPAFAGAWRRRLALKAASASARMARRGDDESLLRDEFLLRMGSAEAGPGGRLLFAWRALECSAPLADEAIEHVIDLLELKVDDALRGALAGVQTLVGYNRPAPRSAAEAASLIFTQRPDAEMLAHWIADAVLAARLGWQLPLPLVAAALLHPSLKVNGRRPYPGAGDWVRCCYAAYGRAAAAACDLYAGLERQSKKLLEVAPQLRAKRADAVIEKLHNEDAVLPSGFNGIMSDRASRRLLERLVALGGVQELSGRTSYRVYGL
jgi:Protein of unknown function (DUF1403)